MAWGQCTLALKWKNFKNVSEVSTAASRLLSHLGGVSGIGVGGVDDAVYVNTTAMTSRLSLAATWGEPEKQPFPKKRGQCSTQLFSELWRINIF